MNGARAAVEFGKGFLTGNCQDIKSLADQAIWMSGAAHGVSSIEDSTAHINMTVTWNGDKYLVKDTGYNLDLQQLRFSIRKVGGTQLHYLAVEHDPEEAVNNFTSPTTDESLDLFSTLLQQGEWQVAA